MRTLSQSLPFVLLFVSDASALGHATRNLNTVKSIYNLTVYPNNFPIVLNGSSAAPAGLFNQNVTGRVSPVGNFSGFEDSIEYFFGLAPVPTPPTYQAFYKAEVVEFTSGCSDVAASVVYLSAAQVDPDTGTKVSGSATTILKQIAFWHFDKEGAVMNYDAWIPNLQDWVELSNGVSYLNQDVQNGTINTICSTTQQRCIDANQQYNNTAECVAILRNKPFGTFDEAWGDNVLCRFIHLTLTKVRPEVHCPHVGPVGGNGPNNYKCTNIDYRTEYFDDVELFGGTKGKTFSCKYIDEK